MNIMGRWGAVVAFLIGWASPSHAEQVTIRLSMLKGIDLTGKVCRPGESEGCKGVVFVFLSPECPISNQYIAKLGEIRPVCEDLGIEFYGVIADPSLTRVQAVKFAEEFKAGFPILFDGNLTIAGSLRPSHVPETFLLSGAGKIQYRGRIDDQFSENLKRRVKVTDESLLIAVKAVAEGKRPPVGSTSPVGCKLNQAGFERPAHAVTFNRDVAPILYANCTECHRAGEVAPFELLTYEHASKRADFLAEVTSARRMPPWKADLSVGHFLGERMLHPNEIRVLKAWAEQGMPQGSPDDLPPVPKFAEGWQLGEPDLVLKMVEPYAVPAVGPDQNRFFVIPIEIPEDKVVVGVEFRPGNPRVVHHAILYLDRSGTARKRDAETPEPGFEGFVATGFRGGGALGFWAPGYTPRKYPDGVGQNLLTKTDLALQLHYHPSGKEEIDQSQVGVHFADKPLPKRIGGVALIDFDVDIPPNEANHRMFHSFTTPTDLAVIDIVPHMHMIGKQMKVTATKPDGEVVPLIWSQWDFNWQDVYRFREVVHLPKGTRIDMEAFFDNSTNNPYNPSTPPQRVTFGEETTDEMCICAFRLIESIDSPASRQALQSAVRESMLQQMKDPKVFTNVTRFMMSGNGQRTPKTPQ
ncbi:MAG: alkyl hydroperoxide reductase [Planctomycetota bacterium]